MIKEAFSRTKSILITFTYHMMLFTPLTSFFSRISMSDSEEEISEKQFKMVLLGDPQSGKTSIATRYAEDKFTKQYAPTVGVEFYLKRTVLPGPRNVALKVRRIYHKKEKEKYIIGDTF